MNDKPKRIIKVNLIFGKVSGKSFSAEGLKGVREVKEVREVFSLNFFNSSNPLFNGRKLTPVEKFMTSLNP
jgi:hypothetical protein